jgi:hypothetical protein
MHTDSINAFAIRTHGRNVRVQGRGASAEERCLTKDVHLVLVELVQVPYRAT